MIDSKDRMILEKINAYIADAAEYIDGFSFKDFVSDKKTISACAFSVSQIGELAKEVGEQIQVQYTTIPWKSIRGLRNGIVHDYENVNPAVLWGTITKSLPTLAKDIEVILNTNP